MNIIVVFQDETGATLASEEIGDSSDPTVIVARRGPDGKLLVDSFEPVEFDDHPDTLRQIGGQVVDFVRRS